MRIMYAAGMFNDSWDLEAIRVAVEGEADRVLTFSEIEEMVCNGTEVVPQRVVANHKYFDSKGNAVGYTIQSVKEAGKTEAIRIDKLKWLIAIGLLDVVNITINVVTNDIWDEEEAYDTWRDNRELEIFNQTMKDIGLDVMYKRLTAYAPVMIPVAVARFGDTGGLARAIPFGKDSTNGTIEAGRIVGYAFAAKIATAYYGIRYVMGRSDRPEPRLEVVPVKAGDVVVMSIDEIKYNMVNPVTSTGDNPYNLPKLFFDMRIKFDIERMQKLSVNKTTLIRLPGEYQAAVDVCRVTCTDNQVLENNYIQIGECINKEWTVQDKYMNTFLPLCAKAVVVDSVAPEPKENSASAGTRSLADSIRKKLFG